jgi:hypothetical protein
MLAVSAILVGHVLSTVAVGRAVNEPYCGGRVVWYVLFRYQSPVRLSHLLTP